VEFTGTNGQLADAGAACGSSGNIINVALTPNSTGAAASNLTAANAAAAVGGEIYFPCPTAGNQYYFSGPIVAYSHAHFHWNQDCQMVQASGIENNMFVNHLAQVTRTNLGQSATVQSAAGSSIATVTMTAQPFTPGQEVLLEGSSLGVASASYVSGLTCTATGTQTGTFVSGSNNATFTINCPTVSAGPTVGAVTMVTSGDNFTFGSPPTTATVTNTTGTGVFTSVLGSTSGAYEGIFPVLTTSTNSFTVQLDRVPEAATAFGTNYVSGPVDTDISLDGFNFNWNSAQNPAFTGTNGVVALFKGVDGLTMTNYQLTNKLHYGVELAGTKNFRLLNDESPVETLKDEIKVYGSAQFGEIDGVIASVTDDVSSIQGEDFSPYNTYDAMGTGGGDIHDVKIRHIHAITRAHCGVFYIDTIHYMWNVGYYDSDCSEGNGTNLSAEWGSNGSSTQTAGNIDNWTYDGIKLLDGTTYASIQMAEITSTHGSVRNLFTSKNTTTANVNSVNMTSTASVQNFDFAFNQCNAPVSATCLLISSTGIKVNAYNNSFSGAATGTGTGINVPLVANVDFHDNNIGTFGYGVFSNSTTGTNLKLHHNLVAAGTNGGLLEFSGSGYTFGAEVDNNSVTSGALVRCQGSSSTVCNITSDGGNTATAGYYVTTSGSPIVNIYGGGNDIQVPGNLATIGTAAGVSFYNTLSTSYPVGPVISNGSYFVPSSGSYTGTTGSIGGSALSASCATGTASIAGVTTSMGVQATASTSGAPDTTGAFRVTGQVTAAGTVTVSVCGTGTPTASTYYVRVQ
jgi:hypothetical protein